MLIKPMPAPADPSKVCKTCGYHDPDLHVCCANDYAIRDEEANTMHCGDWKPKKICITCGHFDPDTNSCWFEEHDMSEEESMTRTCESWEPRKWKLNVFTATETIGMTPVNPAEVVPEAYGPVITKCRTGDHRCKNCAYCNPETNHCTVRSRIMSSPGTTVCMQWVARVPFQPDGSLKLKAKETIGATIMGQGITSATLHIRHCGNCLHQKGDEMCSEPGKPSDEGCKNWEPRQEHEDMLLEICKMQQEKQPVFGGTSLQELEEKQKSDDLEYAKRRKALDYGAKQGMTLEALDTVFAIACQQVPSMEKRWMELKAEINVMFGRKWAAEDMPK